MKLTIIKRILFVAVNVGIALAVLLLLSFSIKFQGDIYCNGNAINIITKNENKFLELDDVKNIISKFDKERFNGKKLKDIDILNLEQMISQLDVVQKVQIYLSNKGMLNIEVETRTPILRVINSNGVSFYIDEKGRKMPFSNKFTSKVIVANGFIDEEEFNGEVSDSSILIDLIALVRTIKKDRFFKNKVQQIYVNEIGEIELITLLGSHVVVLGTIDRLENKLDGLRSFYLKCTDFVDLEKYKSVDLKYKNQIICKKF
ncbi:MAG TPA: hypothetical protein EYQ86_06365 [Bacteroidetes bacterium]|nr:hypothetical protein [Bacteroidota bacterium]